ncbi:MAG TPA: carboxymuconolactone decarboxylase family protein [Thermomicrobiales bacterium]|nr:carboxymuconolactone decarboxylase family protein [Thermomicrobiales bacterium]
MTYRIQDQNAVKGAYQQMMQLEQYIRTQTDIEPTLIHLVKMRASQINGCAYCMAMHTEEALKDGDRVDRYALLSAWHEAPDWFTERERAALLWTETLTKISTEHVTDEMYASVREQFSEKDLADLSLLIITINGWNRLAIPFQSPPSHFDVPTEAGIAVG